VDRDILDKLETPLTHLLRNAVIMAVNPGGSASWREPEECIVRLEARPQRPACWRDRAATARYFIRKAA